MINAYADFGNSFLKIEFDDDVYRFNYNQTVEIIRFLEQKGIETVYFSSVNKSKSNQYEKLSCFESIEDKIDNSGIDFTEISGMGSDRKLGLIGAASIFEQALVTIDCGSAITINFLNNNKSFGGFIIPGLELRLKSLSQLDALENYEADFVEFGKAFTSENAIRIGVLYELAGGITSLINQYSEFLNIQPKNFVITGGNAEIINKALFELNFSVNLKPNLNLIGIKTIINNE